MLGFVGRTILLLCVCGFAPIALAQVSPEEAARLGQDLTPVGAERAGNAEGTIPEWTGGLTEVPEGWTWEQPRVDPYKGERPLFSIDASNVDEHADKLSEGQIALLRTVDGYRMDVYPTHRSCGYPEWIYERTKANATEASLDEDDIYLKKGWHSFLFPIPQSGAEAIWNHQYSYFTQGKIEYYAAAAPTKSGSFVPVRHKRTYLTRFFNPEWKSLEQAKGRSASIVLERTAPARLAGQIVLVHEMLNEQRHAWVYNAGQRRVLRAPTVAYDNPYAGSENMMTNDQSRMFNGLVDRFDWKLKGKRELYVPYNAVATSQGQGLTYKEVLGPKFPRRDLIRYELHRVWVVEATVKAGQRHVYSRRVFYLDEDSWLAVVHDMYDKEGNLWRTMEGLVLPISEVPTCDLDVTFSYDLVAGRYVADTIKMEEPPSDWLAGEEGRVPEGIFTPDALRRLGRR